MSAAVASAPTFDVPEEDRWWKDLMPDCETEDELSTKLLGFTVHEFIYGRTPDNKPTPEALASQAREDEARIKRKAEWKAGTYKAPPPDPKAVQFVKNASGQIEAILPPLEEDELPPAPAPAPPAAAAAATPAPAPARTPALPSAPPMASLGGPDGQKIFPLSEWVGEHGVSHFQETVLAFGEPARGDWSLFQSGDPVLKQARGPRAPYHKHLLYKDPEGFSFRPTTEGWTVGEKAARSGIEYRAFFEPGTAQPKTFGAVRFSDAARADANGFDDFIHGGAIQTLLDEATAECAMIKKCVLPTTVEASFKIQKKVTPNRTYLFECEVTEEITRGVKYKVVGKLLEPHALKPSEAILAVCNATIANIGAIPAARKDRYGE